MTALALRQPTDTTRTRFGRDVRGDRETSTMTKVEEIRALVERDAYAVDPTKVAAAIVARLLAGRPSSEADTRR